jgi:uncharacterized membrane protein
LWRRSAPRLDPDRRAPLRRLTVTAFGLQWLRKAILRSSGFKELHDEDEAFRANRIQAAEAGNERRAGLDWYSFTVAFKGVLLEGLEVVFIVIAFGSAEGHLGLAAAGAALVVVLIAGVLAKGPLSRVPENTIKFVVGLLLTSFGCFWGAEGAGIDWPGDELSLLGVIAFFAALSLVLVRALRRRRVMPVTAAAQASDTSARSAASGGTSSSPMTGASPPGWPLLLGPRSFSRGTVSTRGGCSRPASHRCSQNRCDARSARGGRSSRADSIDAVA